MWSDIMGKMSEIQPLSLKLLEESIIQVCIKEFTKEYYQKRIASNPRQIQAVIDHKSGHTKY